MSAVCNYIFKINYQFVLGLLSLLRILANFLLPS